MNYIGDEQVQVNNPVILSEPQTVLSVATTPDVIEIEAVSVLPSIHPSIPPYPTNLILIFPGFPGLFIEVQILLVTMLSIVFFSNLFRVTNNWNGNVNEATNTPETQVGFFRKKKKKNLKSNNF